jgi:serine/threonine protein phosphatase 1
MKRTFAVGDIHGCLDQLQELITLISPKEEDLLVFLGDYIDRGQKSPEVVDYLIELAREIPCVFLRGNHEHMFLEFLEFGANKTLYFSNGRDEDHRVLSRINTVRVPYPGRQVPQREAPGFLRGPEWHYEDQQYVYVHAGIRPGIPIHAQERTDLIWIRDEFIFAPTEIRKKVIFGHTPFARPLVKEDKIGVDTGAVYGGVLTAVMLPGESFIQSSR